MTRREFLPAASLFTAGTVNLGCTFVAGSQNGFSMHYAPHFGMFRHSAGESLVDQLHFAADQGFTAWEDNGMKGRSRDTQDQIAHVLAQRNMRMGVFVAHTIFWREPNLASGDTDHRDQFLTEIRQSVEVAKRVNATWIDRRPRLC